MRWNVQMANLLPTSSFQANVQGKGTQIKPGSVTELRSQISEFREAWHLEFVGQRSAKEIEQRGNSKT